MSCIYCVLFSVYDAGGPLHFMTLKAWYNLNFWECAILTVQAVMRKIVFKSILKIENKISFQNYFENSFTKYF